MLNNQVLSPKNFDIKTRARYMRIFCVVHPRFFMDENIAESR